MRGIGHTLSRLNAAPARSMLSMRAFIAGAALLAGAVIPAAQAQARTDRQGASEETAMAIPRVSIHGSSGVALPRPLDPSQAVRLREAFAAQDDNHVPAAIRATADLDARDPLIAAVLGDLLADRYLGRFHQASVPELTLWLTTYAGQPDASAIHALLARKLPRGQTPPPIPVVATLDSAALPDPAPEDAEPADHGIARNPVIDAEVMARAQSANPAAALHLITATHGISLAYGDLLRGDVAQVMFTRNLDAQALAAATPAAGRGTVGLPAYIAGLAAWRLDRTAEAATLFETAADAQFAPAALRAAACFWAARAHLRSHDTASYLPWMKRAAEQPRTFYGLLARRTLGLGEGLDWQRETLGEADVDAVSALPGGLHAFALLQIGQDQRAEAVLRQMWPLASGTPGLGHSLMLVASRAGLTDLAAQLATLEQQSDGRPLDYARFPIPRLRPRGGFSVDPALVYALARLESNFDARAVSSAGAHGLMQLMPVTASYIAGGRGGFSPAALQNPGVNLDLGQRYVRYLARQDGIDDNLIYLLASYNSGPNAVARWGPAIRDDGDPLLFIEGIPNAETRNFVQHVLAFTWIYAARLHLPTPSLDELSAGAFPRYAAP